MRFYHPDRNPSAAAEEKVRQVNAAYAVLGDPDRRARYDGQRSVVRAEDPQPYLRSDKGLFVASWFGVAVVSAMLILFSPLLIPIVPSRVAQGIEKADGRGTTAPPKFTVASEIRTRDFEGVPTVASPEKRSDLPIASQGQSSGPSILTAIAAPLRVAWEIRRDFSNPFVRHTRGNSASHSQPQLAKVTLPSPTLATRGPDTVEIEKRDDVLRDDIGKGSEYPRLIVAAVEKPAPSLVPSPGERAPKPKSKASAANPSFSCAAARSWAAASVCKNARLASLDRQLAKLWGDAMAQAGASERARLIESDRKFLSGRDACSSDECVDAAYSAQISQVRRITEGSNSR